MAPVAVIVGAPGAGKSSVGKRVAYRLAVPFADSDSLVEQRAGKSVADVFVSDGEEAFRSMEFEEIDTALTEFNGVLSLGGGAVLDERTRRALLDQRVVWLQVDLASASQRVGMNSARPLLLGNVRSTMITMLEERAPLYEEIADYRVDTSNRALKEVVEDVVVALGGVDE